jgi:hypothetical protein
VGGTCNTNAYKVLATKHKRTTIGVKASRNKYFPHLILNTGNMVKIQRISFKKKVILLPLKTYIYSVHIFLMLTHKKTRLFNLCYYGLPFQMAENEISEACFI